jgi:putative hydrolase of HD superfamily
MMAVVHDLAEAQVGDIAPQEGIPKAEKQRRESVRLFSTARLCSR